MVKVNFLMAEVSYIIASSVRTRSQYIVPWAFSVMGGLELMFNFIPGISNGLYVHIVQLRSVSRFELVSSASLETPQA